MSLFVWSRKKVAASSWSPLCHKITTNITKKGIVYQHHLCHSWWIIVWLDLKDCLWWRVGTSRVTPTCIIEAVETGLGIFIPILCLPAWNGAESQLKKGSLAHLPRGIQANPPPLVAGDSGKEETAFTSNPEWITFKTTKTKWQHPIDSLWNSCGC